MTRLPDSASAKRNGSTDDALRELARVDPERHAEVTRNGIAGAVDLWRARDKRIGAVHAISYAMTDLESAAVKLENASIDLTTEYPEHMGYLSAFVEVLNGMVPKLACLETELTDA